jgi:hypothetical protein
MWREANESKEVLQFFEDAVGFVICFDFAVTWELLMVCLFSWISLVLYSLTLPLVGAIMASQISNLFDMSTLLPTERRLSLSFLC